MPAARRATWPPCRRLPPGSTPLPCGRIRRSAGCGPAAWLPVRSRPRPSVSPCVLKPLRNRLRAPWVARTALRRGFRALGRECVHRTGYTARPSVTSAPASRGGAEETPMNEQNNNPGQQNPGQQQQDPGQQNPGQQQQEQAPGQQDPGTGAGSRQHEQQTQGDRQTQMDQSDRSSGQQSQQGGSYQPEGDRGVQFQAEQGQDDIRFEEDEALGEQMEQGEGGNRQQEQQPGQGQQQEQQAGQGRQPDEGGRSSADNESRSDDR